EGEDQCGEHAGHAGLVPQEQDEQCRVSGRSARGQKLSRSRAEQAFPVRAREQGEHARRLPLRQRAAGRKRMAVEGRGAAIEIAGLGKVYRGGAHRVLALDNINLRIAPGEFVCIVGPSGCGKSTLLRILAGLTAQSGGTIKVDAPGWAVENAMVFQESGLFPWMTVEANVGFGLMTR